MEGQLPSYSIFSRLKTHASIGLRLNVSRLGTVFVGRGEKY